MEEGRVGTTPGYRGEIGKESTVPIFYEGVQDEIIEILPMKSNFARKSVQTADMI